MSADAPPWVPSVPGVLDAAGVARTAAAIASVQEPDGAIPWSAGQQTDVWNHVEAAMGLLVGGEVAAAERAYAWCLATQRADGSWPMKVVVGEVEDHSGETNMAAYLAVGVWHHWLVVNDVGFVRRHWPAVRRALDWVVSMQLPFGGVAWSQEWADGRPESGQRGGPAGRLVEHLPRAAGRVRARRAPRRAAARVGARGRPAGPRAAPAP